MGMAVGPSGGQSANINVTPLIDVLLVLLIIFMVINPPTFKGLDALVPQPPPPNAPKNNTPDRTIVVQLIDRGAGQEPGLKINQEDATWDNLQGRLTDIYKARAEKVMFVKGDDAIPFADVANGEAWLHQMDVGVYPFAHARNHEPRRRRKLLLHRQEIDRLTGKIREKGYTLVPLSLYEKGGRVKVELALVYGKQQHDRRGSDCE